MIRYTSVGTTENKTNKQLNKLTRHSYLSSFILSRGRVYQGNDMQLTTRFHFRRIVAFYSIKNIKFVCITVVVLNQRKW